MKLLLLFFIPSIIFAQSFIISKIPLPKTYIENLDPYECDTLCLQNYLDKGMLFSFLAHADHKLKDKSLDEIRKMNFTILNLGMSNTSNGLNIAMLLPYNKIGKYAASTTNAVFIYLMTKSNSFSLKSYKVASEEQDAIETALKKIEADGYKYVIAPFTKKGVESVIAINPNLNIYFPTVNKNDINTTSPSLYFGGIDYKKQSNILLKKAVSPLVIFSDRSAIGKELAKYQKEEFLTQIIDKNNTEFDDDTNLYKPKKVIQYRVSQRMTNLQRYLKDNKKIDNGSFFINTPIIKTGMIISQLTLYDVNQTNILSTQINYDPLLLSMTQYRDRKKMIIANSITEENNILIEANRLMHNDIVYDWINYSTTIAIDYFYSLITGMPREYKFPMQENQIIYDVELVKLGVSKFLRYNSQN
ncbi:Putative periplasmic protein [hydrothermal vent metagenome]|uniref:Putative periplasmic protein n=1 Tax=hydrothermal vent metagenome TaxID=652676 RepID=A0A1W1C4S2_9ZZZZ